MKRHLLVNAVCATLAIPSLAMAQSQDNVTQLNKVTVTGSLIPRAKVETATPVFSITAQDIQRRGFKDVYDVLRSQPMATGAVQDGQFSNGFTAGAKSLRLLGLDPGFTLVLIDGRPMADYPLLYNGQSNFVDLASVPVGMVERIDVAPGNQSSIYGSSAIAGVVNIILKKHIDGVQMNYRMSTYDGGGGNNQRVQLTGGSTIGKADIVWGLQLNNQDPIYGYQRRHFDSTSDNPDPTLRYGSRIVLHNTLTTYIDPGSANCDALGRLFNSSVQYDNNPNRGNFCSSRTEPGYASILNKERSASGYANLSYAFNDNTEGYATLLLNRTKVEVNSGPRFWQASSDTGGLFYNQNSQQLEGYQHAFAPEETGNLDFNNDRQTADSYNIAAGVKGGLGSSNWTYDAYYARAEYRIDSRQQWPLADRIEDFFREQFLGAQQGEYAGYPIYSPNDANFYRALTPAQYRSFNDESRTKSRTWTQNLNLQLTNTELFNLPAGAVGVAGVLQAGNQYWGNPTDQRVIAGDFYQLTGTQGSGKRDNWAAAFETGVPILSTLNANLSGRFDDYKNQGSGGDSKFTYKAALEFRPIDSLLFRGNYATAFKAPDMAFSFAGDGGFFQYVNDYYRCAVEEPGVRINDCTYSGTSIQGRRSGNPDLQSITAKSWGYGVVWSPSARFSVNADYYNIKLQQKVSDLSSDNLLQTESACRLGSLDISSPTCVDTLSRIERTAADTPVPNRLSRIRINPVNISNEEISGLLAKGTYNWATESWGLFVFDAQYNLTLKHESQQFPQDPVRDLLNEPFFSSDFRSIANASVTWQKDAWTTTLFGQRNGRTPNAAAQQSIDGYAVEDAGKLGAWTTVNATVDYAVNDDISLTMTVNNVANTRPPRDRTNTSYPYYNIFNYTGYGRSYMLELNWRFGAH
ncbi:TonB-dependent outer membrane receptor [Xanthomonas fragariae]|uniref:Colicin I receptor n=3 Tax=Xanthomonas fragariae TaxID=48664 RepID=A0A1Y6HBV1_9XANT|nr:TonB-dependent receptor [Xanthomonas fragariae]AOD16965.1 TonB-dependent receptor [Xanthomonas fragariae]ENZ94996.1 TonB-dependent outer membrane receptor [Xanthomonas fragariae LMG 25863]SMR01014.1 Colicin I receptor precursor [Xanthomonas fragariae]SMR01541.1 TonB-dependent outer membrane receptor [Xanthomonas fragariae]